MERSSLQFARYVLGLSWIYHGFFPKLLTIAPLEQAMTGTLGFSNEVSQWITRGAGVGEILFGVLLITFYQNKAILILNKIALLVLCAFVAVQLPQVLIEAFNPITTNFSLLALSYILLKNRQTV